MPHAHGFQSLWEDPPAGNLDRKEKINGLRNQVY